MTDTKPDVCCVMAEAMWDAMALVETITVWDRSYKNQEVIDITDAIRNHTVVPEMVEVLKRAQSALYGSKIDKADCLWEIERLLVKAAGRK